MAEEKKEEGGGPISDFKFLLVGFVFLLILWYANGGPSRADLRGIFIQPPPPAGPGGAYGPQFGVPATTTPAYYEEPYGYDGPQFQY